MERVSFYFLEILGEFVVVKVLFVIVTFCNSGGGRLEHPRYHKRHYGTLSDGERRTDSKNIYSHTP